MSFHSRHMAYTTNTIRTNTNTMTMAELVAIIIGKTWEEVKELFIVDYEYGNTKKSDLAVIASFFINGFNLLHAGRDIGYDGLPGAVTSAMAHRLARINAEDFYTVGAVLIAARVLDKQALARTIGLPLADDRNRSEGQRIKGKFYKWYSKRVVDGAFKKWSGRAAEKLLVPQEVVDYWMDANVPSPMATPAS